MTHKEYVDEMNLIMKQNPIENDMYYIIERLMRKGKNLNNLSLRDISKRRGRTKRGRVFYGIASVPDFVILDKEFENSEDWQNNIELVYGCVEVKFNKKLYDIEVVLEKVKNRNELDINEAQLLGEVLWYRKVLYINENEWKFLRCDVKDADWKRLKSFVEKEYKNDSEDKRLSQWYLKQELGFNEFSITQTNITEKSISEMDNDEWNIFLANLYSIQWKSNM